MKTDVELTISNIINNYSKPIGNPKTPNEFLINAVLYKKSGDTQQSLINFQKYFEADLLFIEPHLEYHELLNLINDNNAKLDYVNLLEENGNVFFDFVKILFTNSEKALLDELERFNSINPDFELSELFLIKYMIEQDRSTIARNPNSFDICKAIEKYRNAGDRLSTILLNAEFTNYFLDKSQAQNFITSEEKNFINSTANHLNSVAEGILMHGQIPESQLVSVIKNMGFRNCSDEVIQSAIKHVKFADVIDQTEKLNYDKSIKGRFDLTYQDVLVPDEYLIILPEKIYIKSRVVNQYIEMKYYFSGSKLIASGELINMEFKVIDDHTLIYYEDSNEYIYKKTSNVDESSFIDELTQPEDGKYILFLDNTEYGDEMSLVIKNHQVTFFTKQHPNGVSAYYSKSNDAIYFNLGGNEFAFDIIDEYNLVEFSFIKKPEELLKFRKLEKKNP